MTHGKFATITMFVIFVAFEIIGGFLWLISGRDVDSLKFILGVAFMLTGGICGFLWVLHGVLSHFFPTLFAIVLGAALVLSGCLTTSGARITVGVELAEEESIPVGDGLDTVAFTSTINGLESWQIAQTADYRYG